MHCVGLQIIDRTGFLKLNADGEPLEAALTKNLHHIGIMRTITHAYSDSAAKPGHSATRGHSSDTVCWMLLEHCDQGCLAVSGGEVFVSRLGWSQTCMVVNAEP